MTIFIDHFSEFLQHPESQHVVVGDNANFSCTIRHVTDVTWYAFFPNGTYEALRRGTVNVIGIPFQEHVNDDLYTTVTVVATQTWNNTIIRCYANYGTVPQLSNNASLIVYMSLSESVHNHTIRATPI